MMMQRTDTTIPTCRSCFWFCYERNNVGRCGNWERMAIDGIQNLPHRFATDTCEWYKYKNSETGHVIHSPILPEQFIRELIDDELEKSQCEPYDLSDKKVRDSLRGR